MVYLALCWGLWSIWSRVLYRVIIRAYQNYFLMCHYFASWSEYIVVNDSLEKSHMTIPFVYFLIGLFSVFACSFDVLIHFLYSLPTTCIQTLSSFLCSFFSFYWLFPPFLEPLCLVSHLALHVFSLSLPIPSSTLRRFPITWFLPKVLRLES